MRLRCIKKVKNFFLRPTKGARTLDVPVDDAVLVQDVDGCSNLFAVEPDDVFLQPQSGHLLQRALVAVLHEDVHLLLQVSAGGS